MLGGWSSERFVTPMEEYLCAICREVYRDAVSSPCGHTFCKSCLKQAVRQTKQCPSCRIPLLDHTPAFSIRLQIQQSLMTCEYKDSGCDYTGPVSSMATHQHECVYRSQPCDECEEMIRVTLLEEHARTSCPLREITCEKCGEWVVVQAKEQHDQKECPQTMIQCPLCDWIGRRIHHVKTCPKQVIACRYQSYGCEIQVTREEMIAHEATNHMDMVCRTLDRYKKEMDEFKWDHLHDGPLRIRGHSHRLFLCADLSGESCHFCSQRIRPHHESYFGYTCTVCAFTVCVDCLGQHRLYKSKHTIMDVIVQIL